MLVQPQHRAPFMKHKPKLRIKNVVFPPRSGSSRALIGPSLYDLLKDVKTLVVVQGGKTTTYKGCKAVKPTRRRS